MKHQTVDITEGAAEHPANEQGRSKQSAGAAARIRENCGHELQATQDQQGADCNASGKRFGKSCITSARHTLTMKESKRRGCEKSGDLATNGWAHPRRNCGQVLKAMAHQQQ